MTRYSSFSPTSQNTTSESIIKYKNTKKKSARAQIRDWLQEQGSAVRGETALWVAVIMQAMTDALARPKNAEAEYNKHEATRWLTENNRDFIQVCLCAGFDPDYVRKRAKRALASPVRWRAEPGQGERYHERKVQRARRLAQLKRERAHAVYAPIAGINTNPAECAP